MNPDSSPTRSSRRESPSRAAAPIPSAMQCKTTALAAVILSENWAGSGCKKICRLPRSGVRWRPLQTKPMKISTVLVLAGLTAVLGLTATAQEKPASAPEIKRHDGKPADMSKPVKVFILLGQSNMVGLGKVKGGDGSLEFAVKSKNKYPYLVDAEGKWIVRQDVRYVQYMSGKGPLRNEWMTVAGNNLGPEYGIGHVLGNSIDEPVMIVKACIGNRALGWDLLPPGSEQFEFTDSKGVTWVHPGYKGSPERWKKGEEPKAIAWYAGKQWDDDTTDAKKALTDLAKHYPDATKYEVAGFFFWQGERDAGSEGLSSRYEQNLVQFIKQLRKEFNAPNAKFVLGTLGEAKKGSGHKVLEAHLAVDGATGKHPEFKGNVATVYTNPMAQGGSGNGHYGGKAEVYMDVGEAMGRAMLELMDAKK
jgi:hypothetical protein